MVDFHQLLMTIYEIQGISDPNQPSETLAERMQEIREKADEIMEESGFEPD